MSVCPGGRVSNAGHGMGARMIVAACYAPISGCAPAFSSIDRGRLLVCVCVCVCVCVMISPHHGSYLL
jgi:hypothetical protein